MKISWRTVTAAPLLLLLVLGACGGSDSPRSDTNSAFINAAPNIYANGYRLAQHTSTLDYSSSSEPTTRNYAYDFTNNQITITRTQEDEEPRISQLLIDRAGRLIGGSYDYTFGSFGGTTNYTLLYNSLGQVISYADSIYDYHEFRYEQGLLDNIEHFLSNTRWTFTFSYDANGVRLSSTDAVTSETTHFEYNDKGQIVSAMDIDQFGKAGFTYEFEYDEPGNLVLTKSYTPFNQLFSTDTYVYEESEEQIFNHGMMRQQIEPFEATNATFVR